MSKDYTNKKRNKKSLIIIIGTMILGWVIPSFIKITGLSFVDKLVWNVIFSVCLNIATLIVSLGFSIGIVRDNKEKEKTKLSVYLISVIVISCIIATILSFIPKGEPLFIIIVVCVAIVSIIIHIIKFDRTVNEVKTKINPFSKKVDVKNLVETDNRIFIRKPKTLLELWNEHGDNNGSLIVVNSKTADIEWVELTKKPYQKVTVYATVKWRKVEKPKYQEIKNAEKRIWYTYEKTIFHK